MKVKIGGPIIKEILGPVGYFIYNNSVDGATAIRGVYLDDAENAAQKKAKEDFFYCDAIWVEMARTDRQQWYKRHPAPYLSNYSYFMSLNVPRKSEGLDLILSPPDPPPTKGWYSRIVKTQPCHH